MKTKKRTQEEFSQWIARLQNVGIQVKDVECPECGGDGEVYCAFCGNSSGDCQSCGGSGRSKFPTPEDYEKFKEAESLLLELWRKGKAPSITEGETIGSQHFDEGLEDYFKFIHDDEQNPRATVKVIISIKDSQ